MDKPVCPEQQTIRVQESPSLPSALDLLHFRNALIRHLKSVEQSIR